MESKLLLDSKSLPVSDAALVGRTELSSFSSIRLPVDVRFCSEFTSCRGTWSGGRATRLLVPAMRVEPGVDGAFPMACYLRATNGSYLLKTAISSVEQDRIVTEDNWSQISGTNCDSSSLISKSTKLLNAFDDEYGGVFINPDRLPASPDAFAAELHFSLSHWKLKGKKGIWLKLLLEQSELIPIAVKQGFQYHHAEPGYVMLTYWIPDGPSMLPANASHQVGVGGFVINEKKEVLVVQEKYFCAPSFASLWKIPTGFIRESEEIYMGAVREVKEETGINTEFMEVIAFRHAHNVAFDKSDLFFVCLLKPLSSEILVDDLEIQAAKWMPLVDFVEQPLIREDNMFRKIIDICIERLRKRYCGLSAHQLVSKFDGKLSCLYYNVIDAENTYCAAS